LRAYLSPEISRFNCLCKKKIITDEDDENWDPRYIDDKWPNPFRADNPTNLNWENFGYS
jgi:hypothetical protein